MNNDEGDAFPLSTADIKRKRIEREKEAILAQLGGINHERRELKAEMKHAGEIYNKKLTRLGEKVSRLIDKQAALLKRVNQLLNEDGKCGFRGPVILTHKDPAHTAHVCELEFGHGVTPTRHKCACGAEFRMKSE
jgi:hypothetical protein